MKNICLLIATILVLNLSISPFVVLSAAGDATSVQVIADADWAGNSSWKSATLTETATVGTYILRNTDPNAGYAFNWTPAIGTISLYNVSTYVSSMVIPGKVGDVKVTTVASDTFRKSASYSYMVVSENITTLKSNSFRESGLIGIKLPKSITTIESLAFFGCSKLTSINLESTSLSSLGATCFKQSGIVNLSFPTTLKSIPKETFYGCSSLESITFLGQVDKCEGIDNTSGNPAAFYSTPKLKSITFFGKTAPMTTTGFNVASMDYQLKIYYPQGSIGFDAVSFQSAFRNGTVFIKKLKAQVSLQGKPNIGETLTGSFAYIESLTNEPNSKGYWQRSDNLDFRNSEKASQYIYIKSNETSKYILTEADRGKYIRFCITLPNALGEYTNDLFCTSEPTKQIQTFSLKIDIAGAVVGSEFYTAEGMDSYGAKATVFNSTNMEKSFYLVSAWYTEDTDKLVDINVNNYTIAPGTDNNNGYTESTYEGTKKSPTNLANLKSKLFAFDNITNIKPLNDDKTYHGIYNVLNEIVNTSSGGLYTESQISYIRDKVNQGLEPWKSSYEMLIQNADDWINEEPSPVENWYVPGYYTNPDGHIKARSVMVNDLKSAYACGLAYQFTGKAKYAEQAIRILNAWSKTLITIGSEDSVLVFSYVGNGFPMTAELVKGYRGWKVADKGLFDSWMKNIYMSFTGKAGGSGNSGDWGIFARVVGKAYLGNISGMQSDMTELERLITDYIAEDGSLPMENARAGNSVWYTYFALAPMTAACQVIYNTTGVDYFHWTATNGRSVKQALNTYFYYCNHINEWPYYSKPSYPTSFQGSSWPLPLWEAMGGVYNEQNYINFVGNYRPIYGPISDNVYHHIAWFYPTLMYGALQLGGGLPTYTAPTN